MGVSLAIEIKTIVLAIPRDRESDFEPQLVKKHQTRIDKINQSIYQVSTQELASQELTHFEEKRDKSTRLLVKLGDGTRKISVLFLFIRRISVRRFTQLTR
ncbi:hypothetical protein A9G43_03695 [Gilliamella sp. Occ3-1]|nr:hypothetical protein A9G43_03695 [Gilliamella apicola]